MDEQYGQKSRQRLCFEGINGGKTCFDLLGNKQNIETEVKNCAGRDENSPKICPLDISWTMWTPWTQCSANCGHSVKRRTRSCVDGRYGGPKCAVPFEEEDRNCKTKVE